MIEKINDKYFFENGIISYVEQLIGKKKRLFSSPIYINNEIKMNNNKILKCECAFIVDDDIESSSVIRSFANNIATNMGGTHQNGLKNAIKNICYNNNHFFFNLFLLFSFPLEFEFLILFSVLILFIFSPFLEISSNEDLIT